MKRSYTTLKKRNISHNLVATILLTPFLFSSQSVLAEGTTHYIQPDGLYPSAQYSFSHVVTSTRTKTIYLSGQTARTQDGSLVGGSDLEKQMVQVLKNIQTGLAAAGATMKDIVRIEVYMVDWSSDKLPAYSAAMNQFFDPEHLPANTLIGIESLSFPEFLVEITATAVIDNK
jgi:enamine deaminase RidA (YjgF/YER057c/UK114 family)